MKHIVLILLMVFISSCGAEFNVDCLAHCGDTDSSEYYDDDPIDEYEDPPIDDELDDEDDYTLNYNGRVWGLDEEYLDEN